MVVYEKKKLSGLRQKILTEFEKLFLTDNHYKTVDQSEVSAIPTRCKCILESSVTFVPYLKLTDWSANFLMMRKLFSSDCKMTSTQNYFLNSTDILFTSTSISLIQANQ